MRAPLDRALLRYFWLAFGITWGAGGLGLLVGAFRSPAMPLRLHPLHFLAAFGPSIAGAIMVALTRGWTGLRAILLLPFLRQTGAPSAEPRTASAAGGDR